MIPRFENDFNVILYDGTSKTNTPFRTVQGVWKFKRDLARKGFTEVIDRPLYYNYDAIGVKYYHFAVDKNLGVGLDHRMILWQARNAYVEWFDDTIHL